MYIHFSNFIYLCSAFTSTFCRLLQLHLIHLYRTLNSMYTYIIIYFYIYIYIHIYSYIYMYIKNFNYFFHFLRWGVSHSRGRQWPTLSVCRSDSDFSTTGDEFDTSIRFHAAMQREVLMDDIPHTAACDAMLLGVATPVADSCVKDLGPYVPEISLVLSPNSLCAVPDVALVGSMECSSQRAQPENWGIRFFLQSDGGRCRSPASHWVFPRWSESAHHLRLSKFSEVVDHAHHSWAETVPRSSKRPPWAHNCGICPLCWARRAPWTPCSTLWSYVGSLQADLRLFRALWKLGLGSCGCWCGTRSQVTRQYGAFQLTKSAGVNSAYCTGDFMYTNIFITRHSICPSQNHRARHSTARMLKPTSGWLVVSF